MLEAEHVVDLGMPQAERARLATEREQTAVDVGAEAAFAGPASPFEYRFDRIGSAEYSDDDMQAEQGIREALHAEQIPAGIASLGHMLLQQAVKNGLPDDASLEMGRRQGQAELARRHGDGAAQIIASARAVFSRLDKRNPAIGDLLVNSGVANDANFIESLARLAGVRGGG